MDKIPCSHGADVVSTKVDERRAESKDGEIFFPQRHLGLQCWLESEKLWQTYLALGGSRKVLSSMRAHRVRALLMGGQACVFWGAAEFSRQAPR